MTGRLGPYLLDVLLAQGAGTQVWSAGVDDGKDPPSSLPTVPTVAVKVVALGGSSAVAIVQLERELHVLRALDHPNVMCVLDVVREADRVGLVMPLARGGSLADRLAAGPLPVDDVVRIADGLAAALAAVHARGLVHGDVKPANVLFDDAGSGRAGPLLADFGVARALGVAATDDPVAGTVEYLAPEVIDGAAFDPRTDLYALGVTLYEALSGAVPYHGPSALATARDADRGAAPSLATLGVDADLAAVVARAMARRPVDRFADADELRAALAATEAGRRSGGGPTAAASAGVPPSRPTRVFGPRPPLPEPVVERRWPRVAVGAGAVVVVTLGALLAVVAWRRGHTASAACPALQPLAADGGQLLEGDVDGDGCPDRVVWHDPFLSVASARDQGKARTYEIRAADGTPLADGTSLFLGDWRCTGIDTLGIYDRATGEVRTFPDWGGRRVGDALPTPTVTPGAPGTPGSPGAAASTVSIRRGDGHAQCDSVVVTG